MLARFLIGALLLLVPESCFALEGAAQRWFERFEFVHPSAASDGVCTGTIGELPHFVVRPTSLGEQLVRISLPFAPGALPEKMGLRVDSGEQTLQADLRPLTWHPGKPRSVRRGLITFVWAFKSCEPHTFQLKLASPHQQAETKLRQDDDLWSLEFQGLTLRLNPTQVDVVHHDGTTWRASLIGPPRSLDVAQTAILSKTSKGVDGLNLDIEQQAEIVEATPAEKIGATRAEIIEATRAEIIEATRAEIIEATRAEIIEVGNHYLWLRLLVYDPHWPRVIEVRADSLGTVAIEAHLQRLDQGDATAPEFGWELSSPPIKPFGPHTFQKGVACSLPTVDGTYTVSFPAAPHTRRGQVALVASQDTGREERASSESATTTIRYLRCSPQEKVPMQSASWRRAALVIGATGHTPRSTLLESQLPIQITAQAYDAVYGTGMPAQVDLWPVLGDLLRDTHKAIRRSECVGDDGGNITSYSQSQDHGGVFGMNRLNHCPALFEEAWRSGDRSLRDLAVRWCDNMFDLSLWWGDTDTVGGTRYNNAAAMGRHAHQDDKHFMWRSNTAVHFCTKGYDSFLMAYEETGDPRMAAALRAQVAYAKRFVHTNQGECRNIGDVADFMRLYRNTGLDQYRQEGLRLFRELREKLSAGDLFSQGGQLIVADGPFINDDQHGYDTPYAKPYILGYALSGLPQLLQQFPDEEKLLDVVRAVAQFMASSQDPVGGWRYPHPASARIILSQGMEHASQLTRAARVLEARGEPIDSLLDAIERVLQTRVQGFQRSGTILAGLGGWEEATGAIPTGQTIYDLYAKPTDRDRSRDYREGSVQVGGAPPEGLVYLPEVLRFYLAHRPAERLFLASEPLQQVLDRVPDRRLRLIPQAEGSFLRIEHPDDSQVGFKLWAPEWVTFPELGYSKEELGGMALDWQLDPMTGAVSYSLQRERATFTASFVPHTDYVECTYTAWPQAGFQPQGNLGVGPCTQMKGGVFEGDESELMARLWFLAGGEWNSIGSCAQKNPRNVLYLQGHASPEMAGSMASSGWKTIQSLRPDQSLIACTSPDGRWVAATAAEFSTSLCNNAGQSHRCLHSQGSLPLRSDGPTTLRVQVYLLQGGLDELKLRHQADVRRWADTPPTPPAAESGTDTYGVRERRPTFSDARMRRMDFPLALRPTSSKPIVSRAVTRSRRDESRHTYMESLSTPPIRAPFAPRVLATQDRGSYEARKLALNINGDCRIKAYLLVPKTPGPHPGIVALHDHGAHFSIGKEKVVRPFAESEAVLQDAREWVEACYGGRWIGDELARRGYVVLAIDVLYWGDRGRYWGDRGRYGGDRGRYGGDRGRYEGIEYSEQQALASNMFQLGYSWAGYNVWDDIRSAQFLQGLAEVDPDRIGCVGLSMGANRAWHLAAATDSVQVGAAICWMGDTPTLTAAGNNQTTGQSAYSMLHPGLRNALDYADVAALACPKPMLFYNGHQDGLFPVSGVEAAYRTLRKAWSEQAVSDRLVCKLWDVPHVFNQAMQQQAFDWLDRYLQ